MFERRASRSFTRATAQPKNVAGSPSEINESARYRAKAAAKRARALVLKQQAAELEREAADFESVAKILERRGGQQTTRRDQPSRLQDGDQSGTVASVTTLVTNSYDHGLAVSKGRSGDKLTQVANAAGHSIRSLTKAVSLRLGRQIGRSSISMARAGERGLHRDIAEAIEALTKSEKFPRGFEATSKNWPRLVD